MAVPSARHQPPWWRADSTPRARIPQGTGRVQQLRRMQQLRHMQHCGAEHSGAHRPAVTARRPKVRGDDPTYIHERRRPAVRLQH
jgi:hypothetical protein